MLMITTPAAVPTSKGGRDLRQAGIFISLCEFVLRGVLLCGLIIGAFYRYYMFPGVRVQYTQRLLKSYTI